MFAPTVGPITAHEDGTNVVFTLDRAVDNGSPVIRYEVRIFDYTLTPNDYVEHKELCDGATDTVQATLTCVIPMSTFIKDLDYAAGSDIKAKVIAYNDVGDSGLTADSSPLIKAKVPPQTPTGLVATAVARDAITITWTALNSGVPAELGYDAQINSYKVYWDNGLGDDFELATTTLATTVTYTGLTVGSYYKFKISATNDYGESAVSSEVSVRAAARPSKADARVLT